MLADAGFLNHVQAGPPLAQAFRMEAAKKPGGRPGRLETLYTFKQNNGQETFIFPSTLHRW